MGREGNEVGGIGNRTIAVDKDEMCCSKAKKALETDKAMTCSVI